MRFGNPGWLAAALVACALLLWAWRRYDARQRAALARFVSAHLFGDLTQSISVARRRLQRTLYLAAVVLLCVALAGPLWGFRWEQISRRGNEIVFAIDTSRSMSTPDVKPDRLSRAKLAIDDFANRLDGDGVGIVAFAGSAFLACPITLDYGAFHESLGAIDTNTIPRGGTNIASAIEEARTALARRPGSDKILILVTDGEDLEGGALAAAEQAKQQDGLRIFTVGVGTAGGDLIPVPAERGGGFVKDENGAFVKSRLDATALQALAAATGGFYVPLGTQGEGLDRIAKTVLGSLAKHDLASRQQKIYIERFQWPLAASLLLLLASQLIGTRRRRTRRAAPIASEAPGAARGVTPRVAVAARGATATARGATAASLLLLTLIPVHPVRAAAAPGPTEAYNAGTAAYRAGQYNDAAHSFQQSISHAPSSDAQRLADQEDAYYNLGNALYRTGQKTEQSAPQDTLKKWTDAVKAYETALQLRADDADSKYNRDLVKRKIDALQKQQNQNQNQNSPQKNGQGQGQGQPPPGQPPPGQPPPGQQGQQPPGQQPPAGQQPTAGQQPPPPKSAGSKGEPPPAGQPHAAPAGDPGDPAGDPNDPNDAATRAADNQHLPGQMSREEARELLDSVKSDERRPPGTPLARRDADQTPDKPIKDW